MYVHSVHSCILAHIAICPPQKCQCVAVVLSNSNLVEHSLYVPCQRHQFLPSSEFVMSGPCRTWSLSDTSWYFAAQSNTTLSLPGFLGCYTGWWGRYCFRFFNGHLNQSSRLPVCHIPLVSPLNHLVKYMPV